VVRELELALDAFDGPFDLLLTLVLKEELELADVDIADIVLAFVADATGLAESGGPQPAGEADLEACGEFLILVAALLELKARGLFPDDGADDPCELEPEEAAEELARRLAEYRRVKEAARRLGERLESERDRFFRLGPAPLAPTPSRRLAPQAPERLAEALRALAAEPPQPSLAHLELRFPPLSELLARFRAVLARRRRFDFEREVGGLSRVEQAVAFLALLELRKTGEVAIEQARPFAPIRVSAHGASGGTAQGNGEGAWTARSA
jgi:segregation and condensation protein A